MPPLLHIFNLHGKNIVWKYWVIISTFPFTCKGPKNYAEWRASWQGNSRAGANVGNEEGENGQANDIYTQVRCKIIC